MPAALNSQLGVKWALLCSCIFVCFLLFLTQLRSCPLLEDLGLSTSDWTLNSVWFQHSLCVSLNLLKLCWWTNEEGINVSHLSWKVRMWMDRFYPPPPSSTTALSDPLLTLVPQRLIDPVGIFNRLVDIYIGWWFSNSSNHHIIHNNNTR